MSADLSQAERWARLATVARERANEQERLIAEADDEAAGPHREQRRYLLDLAEGYDKLGEKSR